MPIEPKSTVSAKPHGKSVPPKHLVKATESAKTAMIKAPSTSKAIAKHRDPRETERNRIIKQMSEELRGMVDQVLAETGWKTQASLNTVTGGKAAEFMDLHHAQILPPDAYLSLYIRGFDNAKSQSGAQTHRENYERIKRSPTAQKYFALFLKRSYLKHFDKYSRMRPQLEQSLIWIGQNKASYGFLITPVWRGGEWANDRSEIRHFPKRYWTIGHVLASGLVVDGDEDPITFPNVDSYFLQEHARARFRFDLRESACPAVHSLLCAQRPSPSMCRS